MSRTVLTIPASRLRFGVARADITPPVGIYHRMWGAARHDRATGVHRPLTAEVIALAPAGSAVPAYLRLQLDLVGLDTDRVEALAQRLGAVAGLAPEKVDVTFSHTHGSGFLIRDRVSLPGGDLIPPYLDALTERAEAACRSAVLAMTDADVTYATGRCNLAANRDYWDDARQGYSCGFNPDGVADDTLVVARVTGSDGRWLATLVNYGCHPTTLAWDNTVISPDYPGALREEVERATGAPCVFFQGACGDLAPRRQYSGDTALADANGRMLGYAALSALASLGSPARDFAYRGPVVSGATLGDWGETALTAERTAEISAFRGGAFTVDLPMKSLPERGALEAALARHEAESRAAAERCDARAAADARAHAERARRWLWRLVNLPTGDTCPVFYSVYRLGNAFWVTVGGEPYSWLQQELRRRFPDDVVLFSPLSGGVMHVAYLLTRDRYGKGLYQEEPSILAPGCLETLADAVTERMAALR